ncbi:MAG: ATP-binding protein [Lachnospiraceae bacterium]|nr:ATP-binding protein [Lachnospiraceae bacterium]
MIKRIFKNMLLAQIISSAAVTVCMLVDSIMIGQFLGVDAVAAYGLASPVLFIFAAFGALLSTGIQVVCSKSLTKGDEETTNDCYTSSIVLALTVSIVGMIVILIFTDQICVLLGATKGTVVFDLTKQYLRGFLFGAPAFTLSQILVPYMLLSNNRTRLVIAVLLMTVSDILMDILNVLVFDGGIFGMGVASAVSYYVALIAAAVYLLSKSCIYKFVIKRFKWRNVIELLKNGIPTAVNQVCYTLQVYSINRILLSAGHSDGVAVYSVLSTVGSICFAIGSGIGIVALALAGVFYVEEDKHSMHELVGIFVKYAIVLDIIAMIVFIIPAKLIMGMFISDKGHVLMLGTYALRAFLLCLVPSSINSSFKNYFLGIEKTWFSELVSILQNFAYTVLAALILNAIWGLRGVWFAFLAGESLTLLTIAVIAWVRNKKVAIDAPTFAMLSADFGVDDSDVLEFPIASVEQVADASEKAGIFCKEHGADKFICSRMSLCIEEMGTNIIQHGFSDGKEHNMSLRVINKNGSWIIGFRDDCKSFDPVKYRKKHAFDNSYSRLGLKLVFETAKDVRYVNALGLNNLTIML